MNTQINIFKFESRNEIRVIQGEDGEPWFVAVDLCNALELSNPTEAVNSLEPDEKNTLRIADGIPGNPNRVIVSESGLYTLIFRSTKPEARRFRKWVTSEVLPAIRKTGVYSVKPMSPAELLVAQAQMMLDHERRLASLEEQMQAQHAERQEAEQLLLALPEPTSPAPEKTTRANLNERVRSSAKVRQLPYSFVWNQLYRELKYRKSFDVEARADHCKKERLDIIEEAGLLADLYAIACEVLA